MSEEAWSRLLDDLHARAADFVARFVSEMRSLALYDPEVVSLQDLESAAEGAFNTLIGRLRSQDTDGSGYAEELGRRRARQGVPLEWLTQAIRLDLHIVWRMLLELAEPHSTDVLVQNVERLIATVDGFVSDVQEAFVGEVAILQRDSRLATEQHLSKLFNARELNESLLDDIATGIGVGAGMSFEVLMLPNASEEHRGREIDPWLAKHDVFAYMFRGWLLLFRAEIDSRSSWPQDFASVPSVYIDEVAGLRQVPAAARAAVELHGLAGMLDRFTRIEELWPLGAAEYLDSLIPGRFKLLLDLVSELPEDERERVLRTVCTYFNSGSIKETAHLVGCHRNTVINRFRTFQTLTGLDITVPAQAALAYILLARYAANVASG